MLNLSALVALSLQSTPALLPPVVSRAIIRSSAESGSDVAAYAAFAGADSDNRLLAINCSCAERVELHRIVRSEGNVTMTNDWPLVISAAGMTEVRPGSPLHFMLMGTTRPLVAGEQVTMALRFAEGGVRLVRFTVVDDSQAGWAAAAP